MNQPAPTDRPYCEPGPLHPITVEPTHGEVVVRVGERVLARTNSALTLHEAAHSPVHYVPLGDVSPTVLRPSSSSSYCPYKGEASYWSVAVDGLRLDDVAWGYLAPYPAVEVIAGHLAFYTDRVTVEVEVAGDSMVRGG